MYGTIGLSISYLAVVDSVNSGEERNTIEGIWKKHLIVLPEEKRILLVYLQIYYIYIYLIHCLTTIQNVVISCMGVV